MKTYSLSDLKRAVDFEIGQLREYESPDDIPVIVTMSESSVGSRAGTTIHHAGIGMDWEHGQFRIAPDKPLVCKGNTLQDVKPAVCRPYDGRNYYFCDNCGGGGKVSKDDKYCRYCGQRLK